jgi:hypothetical protein
MTKRRSAIPAFVDAVYTREKTIVQKVIDNVHAAIDGPNSLVQQKPETIADKLQSAWATFTDWAQWPTLGNDAERPSRRRPARPAIEVTTQSPRRCRHRRRPGPGNGTGRIKGLLQCCCR